MVPVKVGRPGSRMANCLEGAFPNIVCPSGMGEVVGRQFGECLFDNMAVVVVVVNSDRAMDKTLMHLLRCMFFIAAHWNIHVYATNQELRT